MDSKSLVIIAQLRFLILIDHGAYVAMKIKKTCISVPSKILTEYASCKNLSFRLFFFPQECFISQAL